ncbi:MAG: prolyl oligopeptidase family serine peptidase [Planctomycetaceae bacterium]|nr:prolyl oligopeptidase family serine peptidase [Planctomycetaceae bacterium]
MTTRASRSVLISTGFLSVRRRLFVALSLLLFLPAGLQAAERFTGPWDMGHLKTVPEHTWGEQQGVVREVYYENEPYQGKATRVFGYYARPEKADGPLPGMVLVHGGGGTAFAEWAELWAKRGYAALAMDLAGCGPERKRLDDGGPDQSHAEKFHEFTAATVDTMWTYHAVAAVVRGHSLLASLEGVDGSRIGITGISWGGYLTCIVAGVDDRLKAAVPVYGCGFLQENSAWLKEFAQMSPELRQRWVEFWDPSRYLPGVSCPILFVNGTNDFAYPLDSYQRSYRSVPGPIDLRIEVAMKHSHQHGWAPKEIGFFVDSVLAGGAPLARLSQIHVEGNKVRADVVNKVPVAKGQLHFTSDTGPWQERKWQTVEAQVVDGAICGELPDTRPLVFYLSAIDDRGAITSAQHVAIDK